MNSKIQRYREDAKKYLMPALQHQYFGDGSLVMERANMEYMYDLDGNEYLDCFSGILVTNCGHCNPDITERVVEQARKLQHTSSCYFNQPMIDLARKLGEITPGLLEQTYFVNSGSEAIEGAILLARHFTGNDIVIAMRHGYHGRSMLSNACTGIGVWRYVRPEPTAIHFAPNPNCYRCYFDKEYPGCDLRCIEALEDTIVELGGKVGAILMESILGVGGYVIPPKEYFKEVKALTEKYGIVLIIDEVQTGFARTGRMFAIEHWGIEPDIMTMGKGIANGFTMAAFITRPEIAKALSIPIYSTFGGNPVSSAAALATIEYIEDNDLIGNANKVGGYGMQRLMELKDKYRIIGDVRGMGLLLAIELVKDRSTKEPASEEAARLLVNLKENHVLSGRSGAYGNVVRFTPPLTMTAEQMDVAIDAMDRSLGAI